MIKHQLKSFTLKGYLVESTVEDFQCCEVGVYDQSISIVADIISLLKA